MSDEQLDKYLEMILRASGSSLRHYTMARTRDAMREAMRAVLREHDASAPEA